MIVSNGACERVSTAAALLHLSAALLLARGGG
jgi:hypothetical protein